MRTPHLAVPLAALALAVAGCSYTYNEPGTTVGASGAPVTSGTGAPVVSSGAAPSGRVAGEARPVATLRPGTGTVEAVSAVPAIGSAAAGATAPGGMSRLAIRMTDGTVQYVDYDGRDINVGERVELTGEGYLRKP